MSAPVTYEVVDGIGRLTLTNGAKGNPMNLEMVTALLTGVQAARSSGVGVVLLEARGRFFCVGGDLAQFAAAADPTAHVGEVAGTLHRAISQLIRLDAIVVCAVQGAAAGAGFPLVAACDLVVAARSATFTLAYTKIGLSPDGGSTVLLPASLGLHRVLQLALLNPAVTAEQAAHLGLVAEVVPDGQAGARGLELSVMLAAGPQRAQVAAKHLIRRSIASPETAMELESQQICALVAGHDGQEGIRAFLDKRTAIFESSIN